MDATERLDETSHAVFESHMGGCPACKSYMDDYKKTVELGRYACAEPEGPVPEDAPPELIRAILEARRVGATPARVGSSQLPPA